MAFLGNFKFQIKKFTMERKSPLGSNTGVLNIERRRSSPLNSSMMVDAKDNKVNMGEIKAGIVDNKSDIVDTKGSPGSGAEKENLVFECKSCLAKFKKEKYLKEHKRNCQPNITKMALKVKLLVIFQSEQD